MQHPFENSFDQDKLVFGLQNILLKADFVQEVERQLEKHEVELNKEQMLGSPDRGWQRFVGIIKNVGIKHFGKSNKHDPKFVAFTNKLKKIIAVRAKMRLQANATAPVHVPAPQAKDEQSQQMALAAVWDWRSTSPSYYLHDAHNTHAHTQEASKGTRQAPRRPEGSWRHNLLNHKASTKQK